MLDIFCTIQSKINLLHSLYNINIIDAFFSFAMEKGSVLHENRNLAHAYTSRI